MAIKSKNVLKDKIVLMDDTIFYCPVCEPLWFNNYHQLSKHIFNSHIFIIQKLLDDFSQKHKAISKKDINNKWLI